MAGAVPTVGEKFTFIGGLVLSHVPVSQRTSTDMSERFWTRNPNFSLLYEVHQFPHTLQLCHWFGTLCQPAMTAAGAWSWILGGKERVELHTVPPIRLQGVGREEFIFTFNFTLIWNFTFTFTSGTELKRADGWPRGNNIVNTVYMLGCCGHGHEHYDIWGTFSLSSFTRRKAEATQWESETNEFNWLKSIEAGDSAHRETNKQTELDKLLVPPSHGQKILSTWRKPKVHHRVHNSLTLVLGLLSQINPFHALPPFYI